MVAKRQTQREKREIELYWAAVNRLAGSDNLVMVPDCVVLIADVFNKPEFQVNEDIAKHRRMFEKLR